MLSKISVELAISTRTSLTRSTPPLGALRILQTVRGNASSVLPDCLDRGQNLRQLGLGVMREVTEQIQFTIHATFCQVILNNFQGNLGECVSPDLAALHGKTALSVSMHALTSSRKEDGSGFHLRAPLGGAQEC